MKTFFIAGTDTEVGKTFATCALLAAIASSGQRVAACKPLAAGSCAGKNEDALALQAHMNVALDYQTVNPELLPEAVAPHLAAQRAMRQLSAERLLDGYQKAREQAERKRADWLFVEGAGGWLTPLNHRETMADFVCLARLPVILVVSLRLGCLNHTLLSVRSIQAQGCQCFAWIANSLPQDRDMELRSENFKWLTSRLDCPCLGLIQPARSPRHAASTLNWRLLAD